MIIGIIGGGASGMAAAIAAAADPQNSVIILERQARVGRKLQATGNGRCNLTNLHAMAQGYHGNDPTFVESALATYPVEKTLQWFSDLGLYTVAEESGRVYPYSDQANSVVDVLRFALQKEYICLKTGFEVIRAKKTPNGFLVESADEKIECDKLIIACGGLAGTKLGGSMSGYKLLRGFGHKCTKLRPTLVQLKSSWSGCPSLKGVRANCHVQILCDEVLHSQSQGEIQFTEYGLSGPVIFEVSRDACQGSGNWKAVLNLLPSIAADDLLNDLYRRCKKDLPAEELLTGMLHNRLGRVVLQEAGIRGQRQANELNDYQIREICRLIQNFEVELTETMGMDAAQVTAGGIVTDDFDPNTMESKLNSGLYACGEVLDIDGDCGGYNLQWAWSSGLVAGKHAGGL